MRDQKASIKWCCLGFEGNYQVAGQRGGSILVGRDSEDRAEVVLQYRAVDKGDEQSVKSETPVSLVIDIRMVFCPWCGRNVEKWYAEVADLLYRPNLRITF